MNNVLQNTLLAKLSRFTFSPIVSKKKRPTRTITPKSTSSVKIMLSNPALDLPEGILPILTFQQMVQEELTDMQVNHHQSFILQLNLIEENCKFLNEEARKILALDCLKDLLKHKLRDVHLAFSPTGKLWLLMPNLNERAAIENAKKTFSLIRKFLRAELDVQLPLVELNMYKVGGPLPVIE